ncbi:hypothetical protein MPSEU_000160300 [Mayamaea pseudoterrestris]|nr:hypothetical protein MPSEU_000160300 [Mayamaea pseudoterrestris]
MGITFSNSTMTAKPPKTKNGTPPPVDKLLMPAVGIALALLAYQFFKGISGEIPRINPYDELELRSVFFGEGSDGNSFAVLCHSEETNLPISSVFSEASAETTPADFRLMDCNYVLPSSGKSVAERFKFNLKKRPVIFVSGAVGPPQQVPDKYLKTGNMLAKYLRDKLEIRAAKVETTQDLRSKCLDKDYCGLLLKGTKESPQYLKDAMKNILKEFPTVSFAAVDSTVLYVLNLEEHLPELADGQPRFVVFKKLKGSLEVGGDRLQTSIAALPTNGVSYGLISNLVGDSVSGKKEFQKISTLPVVKTRTKKLEESERAKRKRKLDQSKRSQESRSPSTQPSGSVPTSQENDGSRDGRKAERERRRAEHYASQGKTPEEIAELERQREQKQEEASAWNIESDESYGNDGDDEEDDGEVVDLD